jgi:hypothetical protein
MKPTKHIFLQINTDALIELYQSKLKEQKNPIITDKEALNNCLIYSQGAMSMGDPVKHFTVKTNINRAVGFTILPLYLYTKNLLYFKGFNCEDNRIKTIPEINKTNSHISFIIDGDTLKTEEEVNFTLNAVLEYKNLEGKWQMIEFCIDPHLQVKQGKI